MLLAVVCGFDSVVWFGLSWVLWCFVGLLGIVNCATAGGVLVIVVI